MKKQKGISIIEVLFASVLMIIITISFYMFIINKGERDIKDEVAYTTAEVIFNVSIPLNQYIEDNIDNLPDEITIRDLINGGYTDENKITEKTPLGRELSVYVHKKNDIPLTIGIYQIGKINSGIAERYGLDNEYKIRSFEKKVAYYVSTMIKNQNQSAGVVSPDYRLSWLNGDEDFSLESYIPKGETNISDQYSTAFFMNLQETPGYWVLNYNSVSYDKTEDAMADNGGSFFLHSLGYSDFCSTPSQVPEKRGGSAILSDGFADSTAQLSNMTYNAYICLPASKAEVDNNQKEINLVNQIFTDTEYQGSCYIHNARVNVLEFNIGSRYYSFKNIAGKIDAFCYAQFAPVFYFNDVFEGRINANRISVGMNFDRTYSPVVNDVIVNRVKLN